MYFTARVMFLTYDKRRCHDGGETIHPSRTLPKAISVVSGDLAVILAIAAIHVTSYSRLVVTMAVSIAYFSRCRRRDFFGLSEVLPTSGGHTAAVTFGFDFQQWFSVTKCPFRNTSYKIHPLKAGTWDRHKTGRRTNSSFADRCPSTLVARGIIKNA